MSVREISESDWQKQAVLWNAWQAAKEELEGSKAPLKEKLAIKARVVAAHKEWMEFVWNSRGQVVG